MSPITHQELHDPLNSYRPGVTPLVNHAVSSLRRISRTFGGISDTSSSSLKKPLLLNGAKLADKIDENFQRAVYYLLLDETQPHSAADVRRLFLETYWIVNEGLLPGQAIWREWETKYNIPSAGIRDAFDEFSRECYARMQNPSCDAISLSAWSEKELNTRIHPFYDGCGRVSRAWSVAQLARVNCKWPVFSSREEYFSLIEQPLNVWTSAYRDRISLIDAAGQENHAGFLRRLNELGHDFALIELEDEAYSIAKSGHRGQYRRKQTTALGLPVRYFEHLRAAALLLIDEGGEEFESLPVLVQATLVIACLYHDLAEDTALFGSPAILLPGDWASWREVAAVRIDRFDPRRLYAPASQAFIDADPYPRLSEIVLALTAPSDEELAAHGITPDDPEYAAKEDLLTVEFIRKGGPAAVVVKLCDRTANLRTMENMEASEIVAKIEETKEYLLLLFREFASDSEGGIFAPFIRKLTAVLEKQIVLLEARPDIAQILMDRQ